MTRLTKPGVMMLAALGGAAIVGGCDTRTPSSASQPVLKPVAGGFEVTGASASAIPDPARLATAGVCWQTVSEGGKSLLKEIVCPAGVTYVAPASTPTPAPATGGTTTQPASSVTPAPTAPLNPPAVAGQATFAESGGWVTVTGYSKSNLAAPYAAGQDQNTIWSGLQLPTNQVGSVRPALAGDYLGSPGWSIGSTINANLLGTYQGDVNAGTLTVKLPTAADNGQGGNIAMFRWDGSSWTMSAWNNATPPVSNNFSAFYDQIAGKFFWVNWSVKRR